MTRRDIMTAPIGKRKEKKKMTTKIQNYYFTYGTSDKFPFQQGWTKIEAPSKKAAIEIFRAYHPDQTDGIVNCAWIYDEKEFHNTAMWMKGNYGVHEVEIVLMQHFSVNDTPPWDK